MKSSLQSIFRQFLVLILLALPAAGLTGLLHPRAPSWREPALEPGEVRLETALAWEDVIWLDARSRQEYEEAHIPGALLMNEDEWEGLFFDLMSAWDGDPEQKFVVYCGSTQCQASQKVAERLRVDFGSDEIFVLKGGWNEWVKRNPR